MGSDAVVIKKFMKRVLSVSYSIEIFKLLFLFLSLRVFIKKYERNGNGKYLFTMKRCMNEY